MHADDLVHGGGEAVRTRFDLREIVQRGQALLVVGRGLCRGLADLLLAHAFSSLRSSAAQGLSPMIRSLCSLALWLLALWLEVSRAGDDFEGYALPGRDGGGVLGDQTLFVALGAQLGQARVRPLAEQ